MRYIKEHWPDTHNMRVAGFGYPMPYLRSFIDNSERTFAVIPGKEHAHQWPYDPLSKVANLVCVSDEWAIPLENSSLDRILLIHCIEFTSHYKEFLHEIARVLKPNGRALIIVPNRAGLWAHSEATPFGQGLPYSRLQIVHYLTDQGFTIERVEKALFMPPIDLPYLYNMAYFLENLGKNVLPFWGGVHIVEVSRQAFAKINPGSGKREAVKNYGPLAGVASPRRS